MEKQQSSTRRWRGAALAVLAGVVAMIAGVASSQAQDTPSTTAPVVSTQTAAPDASSTTQPSATPQRGHDGRPCPEDGQGGGDGSSAAPQGGTTAPDTGTTGSTPTPAPSL